MMRRLALICVCCALSVTACTKTDKPGTLPPLPSASPSVSPTPMPQPRNAKAAVVAVARLYYAESNNAISTGQTTNLRSLVTPQCRCLEFVKGIEESWHNGSVRSPNYYVVSKVTFGAFDSPTSAYASVFYTLNKEEDFDSAGKRIAFFPADPKPRSATVECQKVGEVWKVADNVNLG